jgi:molybdopterin molybdotransferase
LSEPRQLLDFTEAIDAVLAHALPGRQVTQRPIHAAAGWVLAEEIRSDSDVPAFDRAAMDGFAFRHVSRPAGSRFRLVATVAAGLPVQLAHPLAPDECVKIMTGAPLPEGADTVVPVEETSGFDAPDGFVTFRALPPPGAHRAPRGQSLRRDQVVLTAGQLLAPQEIAMLAAVGCANVPVHAGPRVAFAATGQELREPGQPLPPGCIRNSNAHALWSQILAARAVPQYLGILPDALEPLRASIASGLAADILILSGGVSMGEFDLVPRVLEELGVRIIFRKLRVRPGQPTLFGVVEHEDPIQRTLVFGLPGNPISTLFAFDQYVLPAVRVFRRHPRPLAPLYHGRLTAAVRKRAGLLTLSACRSEWDGIGFRLHPLFIHGSADIFAIRDADAVAMLPIEPGVVEPDTLVEFRRLYEP